MVHQILQPSDADPASPGPAGWGPVPTLGGDVTTSIPDPVTGTSATSTQQSATAATQSVSQTVFLPPAPTWSALLDPNGNMTAAWITWFQVLNRKLGGYTSTPTDDAQILAYEPETVDQSARAAMAILDAYSGGDVRVVAAPPTDSLWDDSSIGWVKGQKYLAGITASAPLSGLGTVASPPDPAGRAGWDHLSGCRCHPDCGSVGERLQQRRHGQRAPCRLYRRYQACPWLRPGWGCVHCNIYGLPGRP